MAIDLVDLVKGYLTAEIIQQAAIHVGESSGATQKALAGIVPTIVGALTNMASTHDGALQLVRLLDAGTYDGSALNSVTSLFGGGATTTQSAASAGKGILDSLFGARIGSVADLIARFADVRTDSAASLLALAAPLVLHVLGRERASIGPAVSALANLLGEQRSLLTSLPLGLGSVLGWSPSHAGVASRLTREVAQVASSASRTSWVGPLLVLSALTLSFLGWLGWPSTSPEPVAQAARKISELQLPTGFRISVPEGSFNFNLATWLASTSDTRVPRRFVFEDLNFEPGSTRLTPESTATVYSLVAILKAYSAVSVALEGHTDDTGDPAANRKLSFDRALAVRELMVVSGIGESRIAWAGFGQEKPIASNDTEQGRAKNRRLELIVVKR
jgi:OOP family OmpA-OmpF porin